jgi:hypothetical protein
MDSPLFKTLRICPSTQQGGTQTIQQSIYLTHNNPCGLNKLIFQEMGLTSIRYIDLKNYLDAILDADEMISLFQIVREKGTYYINHPEDTQSNYAYLYAVQEWAQASLRNLPVPEDYYRGYRFRINVFDAAGSLYYDSYYPTVKIVGYNESTELYNLIQVEMLPLFPFIQYQPYTDIYKLDVNSNQLAFIGFKAIAMLFSNFPRNQNSTPEVVMSVASLLVDSANTRAFGIPKYGFSARTNLSGFGGITYNCAHFIDVNTIPDQNGHTTLIESLYFRLSLEEDNYYIPVGSINTINTFTPEIQYELLSLYNKKDLTNFKNLYETTLATQENPSDP